MKDNDEYVADRKTMIEEEAALWFARMDAENADTYREEFDAWLAAAPDHRTAFDRVARAHRESSLIADIPGYGPDRDRHGNKDRKFIGAVPASFWTSKTALAASLILGLGLGTGLYRHQLRAQQASQQATNAMLLMTRLGEIRQFRLADGSALTLDTASRAEVSITPQGRRIRLVAGRMRLGIAEDQRPFEIEVGAGRITVTRGLVDLALDVHQEAIVRLLNGRAEVQPLASVMPWSAPVQAITAGQSLVISQDGVGPAPVDPLSGAGTVATPDWPSGWVDCRSITLSNLIDLANHYSPHPIQLEAPSLASLEVSGRFRIADAQSFVRNIADQYDLAIIEDSQTIHLRSK